MFREIPDPELAQFIARTAATAVLHGRTWLQGLALLGALLLPLTVMAEPRTRTLYVANNAIDSATCGTSNAPCRSISRAIDNARDGGSGSVADACRGVRVIGNIAQGNRSFGFNIRGSRHTLRSNISSDNGHGFALGATEEEHLIVGNVATTNEKMARRS